MSTRQKITTLFLRFFFFNLKDSDIRDKLGFIFITNVETYYKNNVQGSQEKFAFYERRYMLHFDVYSNSVTIKGVKSGMTNKAILIVKPNVTQVNSTILWPNNAKKKRRN